MSMTQAVLETRVKTRIRADEATPSPDDLHDNSITTWANEKTRQVVQMLRKPIHFPGLLLKDEALVLTSGTRFSYAGTPSDFELFVDFVCTVTISGTSVYKQARYYEDVKNFNRFDSINFILTPSVNTPICTVAEDDIMVKPASITAGFLDYIKTHPTIAAAVGTSFDSLGDEILVLLVTAEYFKSIPQRNDIADSLVKEAYGLIPNVYNISEPKG